MDEYKRASQAMSSLRTVASLLRELPHLVPFEVRVEILRGFVEDDRKASHADTFRFGVKIRRSHITADAISQIGDLPEAEASRVLRAKFFVQFVDAHGQVEAGIDGGGVF